MIQRLNLLYGIYSILEINTNLGKKDIGLKWFVLKNTNNFFQGLSPKELLINTEELLTFYGLRSYVEKNLEEEHRKYTKTKTPIN